MDNTLNDLKSNLQELEDEKERLENNENTDEYDQMLDEVGLDPDTYPPSMILKKCDPIAYRCGQSDYNDSRLSDLASEIEDKKQEIEDEKNS